MMIPESIDTTAVDNAHITFVPITSPHNSTRVSTDESTFVAPAKEGVDACVEENEHQSSGTSDDESKQLKQAQGPSFSGLKRYFTRRMARRDGIPRRPTYRSWRHRSLRPGPLSGILSLLLSIGSIFASLGVLAGSNHAPTKSWTTPPSTYLAICTAVANLAIRYACIQGVIIAWWSRALRGSILAKLHYDWCSGTTLKDALTSGSHMGWLGLACISSTLVFVDGPLIQRASTTSLVPVNQIVPLNITMAPEIVRISGCQVGSHNDRFDLCFVRVLS